MTRNRFLSLVLLLTAWGCIEPVGLWERGGVPELADAELRVAFVGNSLTSTGNVPLFVQALADADGRSMAHVALTQPNFSLEDHWNEGIESVLRELRADVVVLQQGPSTLEENRAHLIRWSRELATVVREVGGEPALYMVWPARSRRSYFSEVWTSYKAAADTVSGLFIPAGRTWVEAWAIDSSFPLYAADGLHQSGLGALAAGMTIYAVLYDLPADSVPQLDVNVRPETWKLLRAALDASLRKAR